ncbi:hypothetical protein D3C80_1772490 [compost metagenome]
MALGVAIVAPGAGVAHKVVKFVGPVHTLLSEPLHTERIHTYCCVAAGKPERTLDVPEAGPVAVVDAVGAVLVVLM